MLWPLVLPFEITLSLFAVACALCAATAVSRGWKRGRALAVYPGLALLLFVPSCTGIMAVLDTYRFGLFRHATFAEVDDIRVERYLPPQAVDITVDKHPSGHRARYTAGESDLKAFVDSLWNRFGEQSVSPRPEPEEDTPAARDDFESTFGDLGWPTPARVIAWVGPTGKNGGGSVYFYDPATRTAYHRASYW